MPMTSMVEVPTMSHRHGALPPRAPLSPPSRPKTSTTKSSSGRKRQVDPRRNRSGSRGSDFRVAHRTKAVNSEGCEPEATPESVSCKRITDTRKTEGEATTGHPVTADNAVPDAFVDPPAPTDDVGPAHEECEHVEAARDVSPPPSLKRRAPPSPTASRSPSPVRDVGYPSDAPPPSPLSPPAQTDHSSTPVDSWDYPCGFNPNVGRTLKLEYWDRTRECKERKWNHMDYIDATYPSREEWINRSVLADAEILLEPNMFAYNTPRGIEHWTLWSRRDLQLHEVEEFVAGWIRDERPEVVRWNLDENAERSINIYHVHIYFQVVPDHEVRPPVVEDEDDEGSRGRKEDHMEEERADGPEESGGARDGHDGEQGREEDKTADDDECIPSPKRARRH